MLVAYHVRSSQHGIAQYAIRQKKSLHLFSPCISAHTVWGLCWYNFQMVFVTASALGRAQFGDLSICPRKAQRTKVQTLNLRLWVQARGGVGGDTWKINWFINPPYPTAGGPRHPRLHTHRRAIADSTQPIKQRRRTIGDILM